MSLRSSVYEPFYCVDFHCLLNTRFPNYIHATCVAKHLLIFNMNFRLVNQTAHIFCVSMIN